MAQILNEFGKPIRSQPSAREQLHALAMRGTPQHRRAIEARFDAATDSDEFKNYWSASDHLDADSAHSPGVRKKLVSRSRYEVGNNGYADGIVQSICNYLISTGPTLQMQTDDPEFNEEVEQAWKSWAKKVKFRRKLWCMAHAKIQDGEPFGLLRLNPKLDHPVQYDLALFETEQCTTPHLPHYMPNYIDGIKFDEFGNPEHYDILPFHPGGAWAGMASLTPEQVPARFVLHWFHLRRPGQHRGIPEFRSTLNVGASARRWREATVSAAETAASLSALLYTTMGPEEGETPDPMSTHEIMRRMWTVLPDGYDAKQMKGEHPNATFDMFHKAGINEQARPKSVPYNIAACDSSDYNFSSAKLDSNSFHAGLDVERLDCDDLVLDPSVALWWQLAVKVYGWNADPKQLPPHRWAWPKYPVGDTKAHAQTNDTRLRNGSVSLSRLYEEEGNDFEAELPRMAKDYGVSVDEMRAILRKQIFGGGGVNQQNTAPPAPDDDDDDSGGDDEQSTPAGNNGVNGMHAKSSRLNGFPLIHAAAADDDPSEHPRIALSGDVEIIAAAETPEGEQPKPPRFRVKAYTGGALRLNRWSMPVVVDLQGLTFAKTISANLHHEPRSIVGHVDEKDNTGTDLTLAGVVSGTGEAAREFQGNHANGYPWQASIEALPSRVVTVTEGKTVEVNGQTFTGPIQVARRSKLHGIAFLPRGADENTSVTIAAEAAQQEQTEMTFEQWIAAMALDIAVLTDQQKAALKTKYDAEIKAAAADGAEGSQGGGGEGGGGNNTPILAAPEFDLEDIRAGHTDLMADLEAKFAEYEDDVTDRKKLNEIKASARKEAKELKVTALKEKWAAGRFEIEAIKAANKVEVELLKAQAPKGPGIVASNVDMSAPVIEAALALSSGMDKIEEQYDEKTLEAADKHFRHVGLQQVLLMAAAQNGYVSGPAARIHAGNIREVLQYAFPPIHASAASTISLSGILSNVANKELLMGYMEVDQTWREIATVKTVNDLKAVTSYRMLDELEYEEVGPDGEIKHGTVSEESYTRQAKTYAKMAAITRTQILNDDLGAFDDMRTRIGAGAARKFNDIFWAAFMANSTFFTTARGNYKVGNGTALGVDGAGLEEGITLFRLMQSPDEKRIGGRPSLLLVPPELEFIAQSLYVSTNVNTGGSSTKSKVPNANIHVNKYKPVVCDWLSDANFTGNSALAWYLFRNPGVLAAMVVSFLYGMQTPTVESSDADFDTLGVQFRGYHDFGCDQAEPYAGVKLKGEA